jgi:hypothetical protein
MPSYCTQGKIYLKEMGWEIVDWVYLVKERGWW